MSQELPSFDYQTAIERIENDQSLFSQMLEIYLKDTPVLIHALQDALLSGDFQNACLRAHSLKSTSRTVGAVHLGMLAEFVESRMENFGTIEPHEVILAIRNEFEKVKYLILRIQR